MDIRAILSGNIQRTKGMVERTLADFTDEQMFYRPVPGANHATWQLGHLRGATWGMLAGSGGPMNAAALEDKRFTKDTACIDDPTKFPNKAETLRLFAEAMDAAAAWAGSLSEADLDKPAPERVRRMAPTLGDVAILMASHATMHLGQFQVMRRGLGLPILF
jgi:hypothetical protein